MITRRGLLQCLALAPLLGRLRLPSREPERFGPMTVDRHRFLQSQGVHLYVWHHGKDVTRQCRFADDTGEGMAELLLCDANGRHYMSWPDGEVASKTVHGVTFTRGAPFA